MSFDVSAIIPTYNRAHLIGDTIDSILRQTAPPAEIIVVDDGSTDDTAATVARCGNAVRYHRIENSGPGAARNVGVSMARSPWIAFCDSDDVWLPTKQERQLRLHALCPEVECSFTDLTRVVSGEPQSPSLFGEVPPGLWEQHRRIVEDTIWIYDTSFYDRCLSAMPMLPTTLLMSKRRFQQLGGFNPEFFRDLAEDFEFALRIAGEPPVGFLAEALAEFRRHAGSRSGNPFADWAAQAKVLEYALAHHAAARPFLDFVRYELQRRHTLAVGEAFFLGRLDIVRDVAPLVERAQRGWRTSLKIAIAELPLPLARLAQRALVTANRRVVRPIAGARDGVPLR
ncbi:MAG TPA: glycosyltransferase [Stellaceae bacterium]|nr:glycosyltransferase [Stellaceae bacterium]